MDLKRDQAGQQVQEALYDEDETVRVIVVLEEEALLDQGFTTDQIGRQWGQGGPPGRSDDGDPGCHG